MPEPSSVVTVDDDVIAQHGALSEHIGHTVGLYDSGAVYCYQCARWAVDVSPSDGPGPVRAGEEFHRIAGPNPCVREMPGMPSDAPFGPGTMRPDPVPSTEVSTYADKAMYDAAPMASTYPKVHLVSATPDPLGAIAAACRMYEGKPTYSLGEISDDERRKAWEQVQATHLKAPLEFVDLHFFIEGVTRAFTHQMVRQRTAVYAQESLRFAVKADMSESVGLPPSIASSKDGREKFFGTVNKIQEVYNWLIANGFPAEDARALLPHATTTRLNYKTNLRNLLEHAGNRLCTQAQFEWRIVFIGIVQAINEHGLPDSLAMSDTHWQWRHISESGVFKPVCFQVGHCPFNASFDRGCTIRDRVEDGKFDEIKPEEYMSDPTAGWVR
jgi:flavin-dependent thymidylate synthase